MNVRITQGLVGSVAAALLLVGGFASAQTGSWGQGGNHLPAGRAPGVFGTVSAVSGDTLTVSSKSFGRSATSTAYTVNATNATVTKSGATSTVSAITVGDTVMVQGTVSGDSVTATKINDGFGMGMRGGMGQPGQGKPMAGPSITGNGEPVVGGSVTAISGSTLTITNKSNVTYTIDASSATVDKGNATSSVSNIAVGDNVIVQGTVNGNSVTASSVIDQGASPASMGTSTNPMMHGFMGGFFGSLGGIFHKLFGFF